MTADFEAWYGAQLGKSGEIQICTQIEPQRYFEQLAQLNLQIRMCAMATPGFMIPILAMLQAHWDALIRPDVHVEFKEGTLVLHLAPSDVLNAIIDGLERLRGGVAN